MAEEQKVLSKREVQIIELVAEGATNQQIAYQLDISPNTVKVHLRNIFAKLEVASRTEAVTAAARMGLISLPAADTQKAPERFPSFPVRKVGLWKIAYLIFVLLLTGLTLWFVRPQQRRFVSEAPPFPFSDLTLSVRTPPAWKSLPRWRRLTPMPVPLARFAMVGYDGKLYVAGGETSTGVSSGAYVYDPTHGQWAGLPEMPYPAGDVKGAVVGGKLYVPGGISPSGKVLESVAVYDIEEHKWTKAAPLPEPLCAYALAAFGDRIYLFGGWNGEKYVDSVYRYDPADDRWQRMSPLPSPRGFAGAGVLGHRIFVVGGYDGVREMSDVEIYAPAAEGSGVPPWQEGPRLNQARAGLAVTVEGSSMYAIGGGLKSIVSFNERYDAVSGAWSRLESPVSGRWRMPGAATIGPWVYVMGGWNGDYMDVAAAYQSSFRIILPLGS